MSPLGSNLFLTIILLSHIIDLISATCYRLDGTPFAKIRADDGDWIPCNTTNGATSSCCSNKDYCLGNGLCLDAGANNYFSVQGCTDAQWGAPCLSNAACEKNIQDGYSFIWPCGQVNDATYNYCCGESPACCGNKGDLIAVAAVTQVSKAGSASSPTTSPAAGVVGATETVTQTRGAVTVTATAAVDGGSPASTNSTAPPASTASDGSDKMTIGLGAGLGAAVIALAGALLFAAHRLRKKRNKPVEMQGSTQPPQAAFFKSAFSHTTNNSPAFAPYQQQHAFGEASSTRASYMQELESPPPTTAARWNNSNGSDHGSAGGMDATGGSAWYGGHH